MIIYNTQYTHSTTTLKEEMDFVSRHTCTHMRFIMKRSFDYAEKGDFGAAKMSFLADICKSECTKSIKLPFFILDSILSSHGGNIDLFKKSLEDFEICCLCFDS